MNSGEFFCGSTAEGRKLCVETAANLITVDNDLRGGDNYEALAEMAMQETPSEPTKEDFAELEYDLAMQTEIEAATAHLGGNPYDAVVAYERQNVVDLCVLLFRQGKLCSVCPLRPYGEPEPSAQTE